MFVSTMVYAQDLYMVRVKQAFPEAMTELQNAILDHGYKVTRVQRVDIGLTKARYKTDKYRVVFFGKEKEVDAIVKKHPDLIPYLPIKAAIFAEGKQTLIVIMNPDEYGRMYPAKDLQVYFKRWKVDIESILAKLRAIN
jgi:uncharacterized protein (DUF302 family)